MKVVAYGKQREVRFSWWVHVRVGIYYVQLSRWGVAISKEDHAAPRVGVTLWLICCCALVAGAAVLAS